MQTIFLIIFLCFNTICKETDCQIPCNSIKEKFNVQYWECLTNDKKDEILELKSINQYTLNFYKGELQLSDNHKTYRLLDTLISFDVTESKAPLYFYLFNKTLKNADGALSATLGAYCQKIILNNSNYVFIYLSNNKEILNKYAEFLGYELYFKEKGTSTIKYDFQEFKNKLYNSLESCRRSNEEIQINLDHFFKKIKINMKNME